MNASAFCLGFPPEPHCRARHRSVGKSGVRRRPAPAARCPLADALSLIREACVERARLLREWRRRRDTFLLCRRRFFESKKRSESSSCWAFWPRLFARFDVIRAVAGPDAEDVYGHMVRYL